MATILGIDTATRGCSAAVMRDGICLAHEAEIMVRGQSEALAPMMDRVVAAAGIGGFDGLDAVAVTRGPGAFTGLRIGLAAARATALAIGKPCLGIGTIDVLARQALDTIDDVSSFDALLIAIDSKRDDPYFGLVDMTGQPLMAPVACPTAELADRLSGLASVAVAGDAAAQAMEAIIAGIKASIIAGIEMPDAKTLALLASNVVATPERAPALPLYLRPPDAKPNT